MRNRDVSPKIVSSIIVHFVDGDRLIGSRGERLLESCDGGRSWTNLCALQEGLAARWQSGRLLRRLMRTGVHHVVRFGDERWLIFYNKQINVFDERQKRLLSRSGIHGSRPLVVCSSPTGCYYGEYRGNPERRQVSIYRSVDGTTWTPEHVFQNVRHVHAVQWDPYEAALWATTGDEDEECALWRKAGDTQEWQRVSGGSQHRRAVQLVFTPDAIFFGTDAPTVANRIFRLDRKTGATQEVAQVQGPIFYGCAVENRVFFATVCEPTDRSRNRAATVWGGSDSGNDFRPLLAFRKDFLPMRLFQYGQVKFAAGDNPGPWLWLTPISTEMDQLSLAYHVDDLFC